MGLALICRGLGFEEITPENFRQDAERALEGANEAEQPASFECIKANLNMFVTLHNAGV